MNAYRTAFAACLSALILVAGRLPAADAQSAAPSPTATLTVHIKNFAYSPSPLTVKTGDAVVFVNDDQVAHTVTSDPSGAFDSGNMDQNAKWHRTFTKAGTYNYLCTYHTYMKGTLVVSDP